MLDRMKLFLTLLVLALTSACAAGLGTLQADLKAVLPPDARAGVAIGLLTPEAERVVFVGNPAFGLETLFEYGSVTKVFTALLLSELAAEEKVALTDHLNGYLPRAVRDEKWRDVTLVQLATHSAGLPRLPPNVNALYMLRNGDNPYAAFDEKPLFSALEQTELEPPGEFNAYSNFGFGLLGTLLSRATGRPYEAMVETRIFGPLGMTGATTVGWSSRKVAPPLDRNGNETGYWDFAALAGGGAARGSVADALKFLRASIDACRSAGQLAAANCRAQRGTGVKAYEDVAQGLGWVRLASSAGDIVWHDGGTDGFSSFLGFNVRTGDGLVVLANVASLDEVTSLSLEFLTAPK